MQKGVETLVELVRDEIFSLYPAHIKDIEKEVVETLQIWVNNRFPDIPLYELGLEECIVAWFRKSGETKVYIFSLYYDGSSTGTDPCGGDLIFSLENGTVKNLLDTVECASYIQKKISYEKKVNRKEDKMLNW